MRIACLDEHFNAVSNQENVNFFQWLQKCNVDKLEELHFLWNLIYCAKNKEFNLIFLDEFHL